LTPDSNAWEAVLQKQFDLIKTLINSNCSRTTAVRTFESDDQTSSSGRIFMSQNYALVSLIKVQSKQFSTYILI
jgi:hypothetical protein